MLVFVMSGIKAPYLVGNIYIKEALWLGYSRMGKRWYGCYIDNE